MNSLILRTTGRWLLLVLLIFSAYLLWRGHQHPGGGFVAGLTAAGAWALFAIAHGPHVARIALRFPPQSILVLGLVLALSACFASLFTGGVPFQANWLHWGEIHFGTPMLFDLGVYLLVMGAVLMIILDLEES